MKRKQIIILAIVLGLALMGLIIIQTGYLQTAFQLKKAQFDFAVNRALIGVIENIEKKDKLYDLNGRLKDIASAEGKAANRAEGEGNKLNATEDPVGLMDYDETDENNDPVFSRKREAVLKKSLAKYRQARKEKLSSLETAPSISASYKLSGRSLKERLEEIDLRQIIKDCLEHSGITDNFEYAIKERANFIFMSSGFFNSHSEYLYSKYLYVEDEQVNVTFYLIFPDKVRSVWESLMLLLPNIVVTLILILCFGFCLIVIIRQKKLSTIKNDFINNMTHEFKTPIATISLAAQMLKDEAVQQTPETIDHIAGIVKDESKRLTYQVEKVLQTALFTESRMKLKLKKVNLNELIENLLTKFSLRVEDKNGQLVGYLDAENDEVYADEVHITNVLSNLLDNALKYCIKAPDISVYTRNRGDKIVISVIDNGIGIAVKEQKLIFERFYRISTGNLHDVKGFGLGLSYVKQIVDAHNGKIEVESTLEKGSRFDIILPLASKK